MDGEQSSGGSRLEAYGDVSVGGDVAGHDIIRPSIDQSTHIITTTINGSEKVARLAVIGVIAIAALAIITIALMWHRPASPAAPTGVGAALPPAETHPAVASAISPATLASIPATATPNPTPCVYSRPLIPGANLAGTVVITPPGDVVVSHG